ncbi:hypothetical protein BS50DRAFT_151705 [Corynespora cassiicola Philippines]|uniref:DUF7029 domain-containing protein n=1 Tax=Corynespora cassiicola Philippines TaxID=1448308 RepID=A0A2T2N7J7_CORCC|nr:hypothetical protein BS50DRAFT_151705 [Corynespora cassiicola Philippines]
MGGFSRISALLLAAGYLGSEVAAAAVPAVPVPSAPQTDRVLRAATRRSNLHRRGLRIEKKFGSELAYIEEENGLSGRPVFASHVTVGSKKPILNLEEIEDYLQDVKCGSDGKMKLVFKDRIAARDARLACSDEDGGLIITSHEGCNVDGERSVYSVKDIAFADDENALELAVAEKMWKDAFDHFDISFGHTTDKFHYRTHRDFARRKRQEAGEPDITPQPVEIPTDIPDDVNSVEFDLTWEKIDEVFSVSDFTAGLEQFVNVPTPADLPIELGCTECSTQGTITLSQGAFEIDVGELDVVPDFLQGGDDGKDISSVITGGFIELKANSVFGHFDLFARPRAAGSFEITLFSLPVLGFTIPNIGRAGAVFEAGLSADYDVEGGLDLSYGIDVTVPDDASMRIELGDLKKSGVSGFAESTLEPLPFSANVTDVDILLGLAFVPTIPIGFMFADKLDASVTVSMDLPRLDALITAKPNGDCKSILGGNSTSVASLGNSTNGDLSPVIIVDANVSIVLDVGADFSFPILPIDPIGTAAEIFSTKFELGTRCLAPGEGFAQATGAAAAGVGNQLPGFVLTAGYGDSASTCGGSTVTVYQPPPTGGAQYPPYEPSAPVIEPPVITPPPCSGYDCPDSPESPPSPPVQSEPNCNGYECPKPPSPPVESNPPPPPAESDPGCNGYDCPPPVAPPQSEPPSPPQSEPVSPPVESDPGCNGYDCPQQPPVEPPIEPPVTTTPCDSSTLPPATEPPKTDSPPPEIPSAPVEPPVSTAPPSPPEQPSSPPESPPEQPSSPPENPPEQPSSPPENPPVEPPKTTAPPPPPSTDVPEPPSTTVCDDYSCNESPENPPSQPAIPPMEPPSTTESSEQPTPPPENPPEVPSVPVEPPVSSSMVEPPPEAPTPPPCDGYDCTETPDVPSQPVEPPMSTPPPPPVDEPSVPAEPPVSPPSTGDIFPTPPPCDGYDCPENPDVPSQPAEPPVSTPTPPPTVEEPSEPVNPPVSPPSTGDIVPTPPPENPESPPEQPPTTSAPECDGYGCEPPTETPPPSGDEPSKPIEPPVSTPPTEPPTETPPPCDGDCPQEPPAEPPVSTPVTEPPTETPPPCDGDCPTEPPTETPPPCDGYDCNNSQPPTEPPTETPPPGGYEPSKPAEPPVSTPPTEPPTETPPPCDGDCPTEPPTETPPPCDGYDCPTESSPPCSGPDCPSEPPVQTPPPSAETPCTTSSTQTITLSTGGTGGGGYPNTTAGGYGHTPPSYPPATTMVEVPPPYGGYPPPASHTGNMTMQTGFLDGPTGTRPPMQTTSPAQFTGAAVPRAVPIAVDAKGLGWQGAVLVMSLFAGGFMLL